MWCRFRSQAEFSRVVDLFVHSDIRSSVALRINSGFRFSAIIRICKNKISWFQNYLRTTLAVCEGTWQTGDSRKSIRSTTKIENCSFTDINLRLDRRIRHTQAAIGTIWFCEGYRDDRKRNSLVRLPSLANHPLSPLSFSSRRIAIMLILTMRFIASFRSRASMRRTKLRKNDGKSFRLRFTLSPFDHTLIPDLRDYIPLSHSSASIRSRSNACTFGIRVLEVENMELHYMGGERVSSTQSRVFVLTRWRNL